MANSKARPYGVGFNGHARVCDCVRCANVRKRVLDRRLSVMQNLGNNVARMPTSADQTVFVRAHFKRSPNHLRKYSRTRMAVSAVLKRYVA